MQTNKIASGKSGFDDNENTTKNNGQTYVTKSKNLNDYIFQNLIGCGSFGKVYKVKDKQTQKIYAAKVSIDAIDETTRELFLSISSEVDIISKLNHPTVLKFILYSPINIKKKPKPVIITEYASNGSLQTILEHDLANPTKRILNDTRKLIIIYGIVSAMSYLHSHDILHRDLKPDNVLLDDYLFPKISDFGLSKSGNPLQGSIVLNTSNGTIKGTPSYLSPEIWSKSKYSKSSDVYAFSIVLYQIMTCEKPYPAMDIFSLGYKVANGARPDFNVEVAEAYKDLIIRCWSENPENRPTFDQILHELQTDRKYIIETVNESEYKNFINYIEEQKTSFDSSKQTSQIISFSKYISSYLNGNKKSDTELHELIKMFNYHYTRFPFKYFKNLCEESQKLVEEANGNSVSPEKLFEVGRNLVEGRHDFPIDVKIGLDFIKESMNQGNKNSLIYYIEMLIKGKLIPANHKRALKLIDTKLSNDESTYFHMKGKLFKSEKRFAECAEFFKRSIQLGNDESLYEYAELQRKSLYKPEIETEEINQYYREAIKHSHLKSMLRYGRILLDNKTDKKQQKEGIALIKDAAEKGNIKANYYYGQIIEENKDIKIEERDSMKYFKLAADEGHVESMNKVGIKLFEYIESLPKIENLDEPIRYLKKASFKGCLQSMYQYGRILVEFVNPSNEKEGTRLFKISADNGYAESMSEYASSLTKGIGVEVNYEEAIRYCKMGIDKGSPEAMCSYAYMLLKGHGVEFNYKEAVRYIKMAVDAGFATALDIYATILESNLNGAPNYTEAAKYYKMAIDKGNTNAMFHYAYMLLDMPGKENYYDEAHKYFKMAIDKGNSDAMNYYAYTLENGIGSEVNYKEAIKYYKMAIDKGNPTAMSYYACMLKDGKGIKVNYEEAIKYFKMAIDKGYHPAMNNYANMLENGLGVEVNYEEAIKYYKMAIAKGNSAAMNNYALMLKDGHGTDVNYEEAIKYFKMAIDKGNLESMYNYAYMLVNGLGVEANCEEAIEYLKIAIDKGCHEAMNYYAYLLETGVGIEVNYEEAIKYYKMAIDKGNATAMHNYACMLKNGKGIEVNYEEAIKYYKMAIDKGIPNSMNYYANMLENGLGVEVNYEEAVKYYKMAIDKDFPLAMTNYANMLYNGKGVPLNKDEANKYYKMAISKNETEAMLLYGKILLAENVSVQDKEEGISYIKESADKDNVNAIYEYGSLLEENKFDFPDRNNEIIKYSEKAAKKEIKKQKKFVEVLNE